MLLVPPAAAPDEPSHLTRAGSLADGQLDGEELPQPGLSGYLLSDSYLLPDPACSAFDPTTPVDCAAVPEQTGASVQLASRADEYPIPGHLVYGIGSRAPGVDPIWGARLIGVAIAVALVGAALTTRRTPLAAAGVVVAMTPMAWATVATVNPSSFGTAGAVALWCVLLAPHPSAAMTGWITAAGWAALALPRRDGLIWASLILVIALASTDVGVDEWWRRLSLGPRAAIVASSVATLVWGATNDRRVSQMVVLTPLVIVAALAARRVWLRHGSTRARRASIVAAGAAAGAVAAVGVVLARPGGWDGPLARAVVEQTGDNLVEAIGVLGWLDTHLPTAAIMIAAASVGALAAASLTDRPHAVTLALVVVGTAIATSWVFELFQGNQSGRYWQGRYSLPLLAGVPIALATGARDRDRDRRIAWVAGGGMLLVVNVAAWAGARRWGVGVDGSLLPWRWDTVHTPVEPFVVLVAHAVLSVGLARVLFGAGSAPAPDAVGVDDERRGARTAR